jgi:hypothetical protein
MVMRFMQWKMPRRPPELELKIIQTQMAQKPMLREEVYEHDPEDPHNVFSDRPHGPAAGPLGVASQNFGSALRARIRPRPSTHAHGGEQHAGLVVQAAPPNTHHPKAPFRVPGAFGVPGRKESEVRPLARDPAPTGYLWWVPARYLSPRGTRLVLFPLAPGSCPSLNSTHPVPIFPGARPAQLKSTLFECL